MRKGDLNNGIKAFVLSSNRSKLSEIGDDYLTRGLFSNAINCYKLAGDKTKLLKSLLLCTKTTNKI